MFEVPEQMLVLPVIASGCVGKGLTVMDSVCAEEFPQELLAVTVIFPLTAPAVAFIELEVELPVQPLGKFQV